jgi:hypothetical protein
LLPTAGLTCFGVDSGGHARIEYALNQTVVW